MSGCCKTLFLFIASGSALNTNVTPFKRTPTVFSSGLSRRAETVLTHSYSAKLRTSGAAPPFMAGTKLLQSMLLLEAPPFRTNPKRLLVRHTYHNSHLHFILRLQCQFRVKFQQRSQNLFLFGDKNTLNGHSNHRTCFRCVIRS